MTAELLDPPTRFEVQPELCEDGTSGPPRRLTMSMRPCWRKPPVQVVLKYLYEIDGVAYYVVDC